MEVFPEEYFEYFEYFEIHSTRLALVELVLSIDKFGL